MVTLEVVVRVTSLVQLELKDEEVDKVELAADVLK